ncbi:MAG TPA: ABC-F family ATP-binding cassette domain-containing protein [Gaiellaceae bacterium]|jgi:ATP-binding cassette subfamily F protein 3|nr:ABC-F family ATP-binding cassette domain-containing protein [Gaiellaceae bacterium]
MSLLQARGLAKSFGSRLILDGLDFDIEPDVRLGVIGPNGGGKSTLLRILAGEEVADAGEVTQRRGLNVAFLPQQLEGDTRHALETLRAARPDLDALEQELATVERSLGEAGEDLDRLTKLLKRQEGLLERWTAAGGPGFEGRARALLVDVGLDDGDLAKPTRVLSGGQRKLVGLAACLLRDPDVLLLDEPEAHLDVEARERMESLMRSFDGAVVAVSHDRYLLDETVSQIAELAGGKVRMWPGNYSAYTIARELELQRQQQMYVTQQKEIARLEEAIRRFKDWASRVVDERHIKQARNKQRQIDRMEKVDRPVLERRKIALELRPHARGGERVVELASVGVELGERPILTDVDLTVLRGERVGVVGDNGAGKSVLLRVLAGDLDPTEGERKAGPSIRFGRLAQDRRPDDPKATPLQLVRRAAPISEGEAVSRLMKFLFSYEQVRRPLDSLSGGEWTRLQLLLLMLEGANCLLLDEPTNHLDIESVEMLESALESFEGTAIFVSHDRYFLDRISDRILEVSDGEVRSYEGGWSSWRRAAAPSAAAV